MSGNREALEEISNGKVWATEGGRYPNIERMVRLEPVPFKCGNCGSGGFGDPVAVYTSKTEAFVKGYVLMCGNCKMPNVHHFQAGVVWPSPQIVRPIKNLPAHLAVCYDEACAALSANAPTATMLMCRKIVFAVAGDKGMLIPPRPKSPRFAECIDYLISGGHVPATWKKTFSAIVDLGNAATHELDPVSTSDANTMFELVVGILKSIYEIAGHASP